MRLLADQSGRYALVWIFINDAMISAVEHRDDPRVLVVRARLKGDLGRFFGRRFRVTETPDADYRYRTYCSRAMLRHALARAVDRIDYDNFKGSVADRVRHDAYLDVWMAMFRAQRDEIERLSPRGRRRPWSLFAREWNLNGDQPLPYAEIPYERLPPIGDIVGKDRARAFGIDDDYDPDDDGDFMSDRGFRRARRR